MKPVASYSLDDLDSPYDSNPLRNIAKAVRDTVCAASPTPLSEQNGPLQWLRDGVRNSYGCPEPPPGSTPPSRQYNTPQGKCPGAIVSFDVPFSYTIIRPDGSTEPFSSVGGGAGVPTPVTNIREDRSAGGIRFFADIGVPGQPGYGVNQNVATLSLPAENQYSGLQYQVNLRTISGDPDNCLNPAPTYPPTPPRDSPGGPPKIVLPPIIYIPIRPTVNIPVTLKPNFTINANVNVRVADSIDVQIGPKSVDIYINPQANIDIYPDAPDPGYELPDGYPDDPSGNAGEDGSGGSGDCASAEDLENAIDVLAEIQEQLNRIELCSCDSTPQVPVVLGSAAGNNGNVVLPPGTILVRLVLDVIPENPKQEWGGGAAPDVYYAGWTAFAVGAFSGARSPIDYKQKSFVVPKYANRFTWTCRRGYEANIEFYGLAPA